MFFVAIPKNTIIISFVRAGKCSKIIKKFTYLRPLLEYVYDYTGKITNANRCHLRCAKAQQQKVSKTMTMLLIIMIIAI